MPEGSCTAAASRRSASASAACRSRAVWSPAASVVRAVSFIMTTSLLSAKTMPLLCRHARM